MEGLEGQVPQVFQYSWSDFLFLLLPLPCAPCAKDIGQCLPLEMASPSSMQGKGTEAAARTERQRGDIAGIRLAVENSARFVWFLFFSLTEKQAEDVSVLLVLLRLCFCQWVCIPVQKHEHVHEGAVQDCRIVP